MNNCIMQGCNNLCDPGCQFCADCCYKKTHKSEDYCKSALCLNPPKEGRTYCIECLELARKIAGLEASVDNIRRPLEVVEPKPRECWNELFELISGGKTITWGGLEGNTYFCIHKDKLYEWRKKWDV